MERLGKLLWPALAVVLGSLALASGPIHVWLTTPALARMLPGRWELVVGGDEFMEFEPAESLLVGIVRVLPKAVPGADCAVSGSRCGRYAVVDDSTLQLYGLGNTSYLVAAVEGRDRMRLRLIRGGTSDTAVARRAGSIASPSARGLPNPAAVEDNQTVGLLDAELQRLRSTQAIRFADSLSYAADLTQLGFVPTEGVTLTLDFAGTSGWMATARRAGSERRCALFVGSTPPASRTVWDAIVREGFVFCH